MIRCKLCLTTLTARYARHECKTFKKPEAKGAVKSATTETVPSSWQPITDPRLLKILGKTGEESAELGKILFRTIIQGLDEVDPETGKVNRLSIQEEVADVYAKLAMIETELGLDKKAITARAKRKAALFDGWLEELTPRKH